MARNEGGAALLEVLVALAILGAAGIGLTAETAQALASVRRIHASEAAIADASADLDAVALWPREDLDRHLGDRRSGIWRLAVRRITPELYEITLSDSSGTRLLLSTSLYRRNVPASP